MLSFIISYNVKLLIQIYLRFYGQKKQQKQKNNNNWTEPCSLEYLK